MFGFKRRRRKRLREQSFPVDWRAILEMNAPYYSILPPEDQRELEGHIAVIIAEKNFEGCGGLQLTNEIRVTIAAHAGILLLHRETDYYPRLDSILVYPRPFFAETATRGPGKTYIKGRESRVGESWNTGAVIFAWSDVKRSLLHRDEGHNVLYHEFAHQLDSENFVSDGFPIMDDEEIAEEWSEAFSEAYNQFIDDVEQGRETIIDEYGAESPPEFFAVLTETFFELPVELSEDYPDLYQAMKHYFNQDPAQLVLQAEQRKPEQGAQFQ